MIIGLGITWIFWSVMIGILIYCKRSWVNVIAIPVVLSIPVVVLGNIYEPLAFWGPVLFYIILTGYILLQLKKM